MPRGIAHDKYVSGAFELDVLIGMVEEDLEDLRFALTDSECAAYRFFES